MSHEKARKRNNFCGIVFQTQKNNVLEFDQ